ncbi:hypothetical protein G7054_g6457 [Neopestalotiopsis clavispora]|nr:hypothetical protein G7054_g6457 [Neopestalotiopsis clavispora]
MAPSMAPGPWGARFVASHILISEPDDSKNPLDTIPLEWKDIRFDAVDVLFVSPFRVKTNDLSFNPINRDGLQLNTRLQWVIRAARSKNPKIKIIAVQFYDQGPSSNLRAFGGDQGKIERYAKSVAGFIGTWYNKTLPALTGSGTVSARIDGYDVDVEDDTLVDDLPKVLAAVRNAFNNLSSELRSSRFSVSITPAVPAALDDTIASSCDYINMQNYSGGRDTAPEEYIQAVHDLRPEQLVWGFTSEEPWRNTLTNFPEAKQKVNEVLKGPIPGIFTWRLNSNNHVYENIFQVWIYDVVHQTTLPGSKEESIVKKYWPLGGRAGNQDGLPILPQNLT